MYIFYRWGVGNSIAPAGDVNKRIKLKSRRQKWMEVVYVSEDIMVTRTNYDHFCVRTKLYQYWNPAADAGWMYVDGV